MRASWPSGRWPETPAAGGSEVFVAPVPPRIRSGGAATGGLLYWWQREHKVELAALLDRLGLDVSELTARIEENHVSAPDLGRVADIEGLV